MHLKTVSNSLRTLTAFQNHRSHEFSCRDVLHTRPQNRPITFISGRDKCMQCSITQWRSGRQILTPILTPLTIKSPRSPSSKRIHCGNISTMHKTSPSKRGVPLCRKSAAHKPIFSRSGWRLYEYLCSARAVHDVITSTSSLLRRSYTLRPDLSAHSM